MIANLPLLFANGNPSALSKINAAELEKFITFMVTCSWGHDTVKDIRQPPWWPKDVAFSHPFVRPREVPADWEARLKQLVKRCYDFHKSAFLLVFSAQLARYPRNRLRYVDNRDHTTSLYYRPSGRLLVTFRNENLHYDKCPEEKLTKPADIYLCDNCDSHFDNLEILSAHERLCNNDNAPTSTCSGGFPEFLSALKLLPVGEKLVNVNKNTADTRPKNSRTAANIDRGPPYPFSSLAYMKNLKPHTPRDTTYSRERVERYCCTSAPINKYVGSKGKSQQFPVRYRRPIDYWQRKHIFPNQRNKKLLDINGQLLMLKCKPISVAIERMSLKKVNEYIDNLKREAELRAPQEKDIIFVDVDAETKSSSTPKSVDVECEVIDLCSDDESSAANENCDPRAALAGAAGGACVMRGGAVLRRTVAAPLAQQAVEAQLRRAAATPLAQPAQPCGARQRPLPATLLQPHPVILIAHSLNSLQTISID